MVADEGKGPDFILEVLHQGNRDKDPVHHVSTYARLGLRLRLTLKTTRAWPTAEEA